MGAAMPVKQLLAFCSQTFVPICQQLQTDSSLCHINSLRVDKLWITLIIREVYKFYRLHIKEFYNKINVICIALAVL